MMCEAAPLIEEFDLTKTDSPFPLYCNQNIALILSGVGIVAAASATAHALTRYPDSVLWNIGVAGTDNPIIAIGTLFGIRKLIASYNDKVYHLTSPDLGTEAQSLKTVFRMYESKGDVGRNLYDMEATAIFESARTFLPPERIKFLKIVSDYCDGSSLDSEFVHTLVQNKIPFIRSALDMT